eukprot:scaffold132937_cov33-Phaeocystis_antarctica.AAC.1
MANRTSWAFWAVQDFRYLLLGIRVIAGRRHLWVSKLACCVSEGRVRRSSPKVESEGRVRRGPAPNRCHIF